MYHPGICTLCTTRVYAPLYTHGYTTVGTQQTTVQAPRHREDRCTALRRVVTEQYISDGWVTVLTRLLSVSRYYSRFTVGWCCLHPWVIPYGGGLLCAERSPSVHPIVVNNEAMRGVSSAHYWSESVDQAGIALGPEPPDIHPFHCPRMENHHYSRSCSWGV